MNLRRRGVNARACMVPLARLVCSYVGVAAAGCAARASVDTWALSAVGAHLPSKHSRHYKSCRISRSFLVGSWFVMKAHAF